MKFSLAWSPAGTVSELGFPAGRRPEFLSGLPVGTQFIVFFALLRVLQDFVGFVELFEFILGPLLLAHVGMILARQFPIGPLDLLLSRRAGHIQHFVVVSELNSHRSPIPLP
jgi:hypothetical protein